MKKRNLFILVAVNVIILLAINLLHKPEQPNLALEELKVEYAQPHQSSVDHSKFPELQKEFATPQDVTEACISCHTERHKEVIESSHWNWARISYIEGKGLRALGKKNVVNNFCIGSQSNEQACAKCHIGFGMTDDTFDFNNARNVDCMVCHDNSEEYLKGSATAGYPDRSVNLAKVAQSVGSPKKSNCGTCHFYSGGGNNVKHGDLEEALLATTREVDVHMAANGINLECVACHTAENHDMKGRLYSVSSENTHRATCEQCHTNTPHMEDMLNRHTARVSCQACHIPEYAKENATKMAWKWSEAGKLKAGQPYHEEDSLGNHTYLSIKGEFVWEKNVKPDYVWFNGHAKHYLLGDTIDMDHLPLKINELLGSARDKQSKIYPVKIHRGDQIYDKQYKYLIQPKLYAEVEGDSAFWKDFDWSTAAAAGMKRIGLPYSGEYGFIETEMYWPINHMVAPKEETVSCSECHNSQDSRLASLTNFYMPGRDREPFFDTLGLIIVTLSVIGVVLHGGFRIFFYLKNKDYKTIQTDTKEE
ncbi:MAG: tetrathionate reductase family octaheme c-type cytochrome [Candidatus Cyclobacteriaceae bacterium M3_2C_046]